MQIIRVAVLFFWFVGLGQADPVPTWKTVSELSETERAELDLRTDTPRDPRIPYLPAEKYPFAPPYTAEELGYRGVMEFPHMPRWSCAVTDAFGSITSDGFLQQFQTPGVIHYIPEGGLGELLYTTPPGKEVFRWLFHYTAPPESAGDQFVWIGYRTDQTFLTRLDFFFYSRTLRRVRRMPQPRRDDRFANTVQTIDDILGIDAWAFSWRHLGTDVLYETVRFPNTRSTITVAGTDGTFTDMPIKDLKMLGKDYPYYTAEGGVPCYVVEATARKAWLPDYAAPKILYWLDRHHFYPLRIESYDREGKLFKIEVRTARLRNPELKERGYSSFITIYYDLALDFMTYGFHDSYQPLEWSENDKQVLFSPDSMRRGWTQPPVELKEEIRSPEEFYVRPLLYPEKFPQDRRIEVPAELEARIRAQEAAGHLVFGSGGEAESP